MLCSSDRRNGMSLKDWQEKRVMGRRMKEEASRRAWESIADYYKTWNVKSSKYESLASSQTFKASMDAYEHRTKDSSETEDLERRRTKLRELLRRENERNEEELKAVLRAERAGRRLECRPATAPLISRDVLAREKLDILPYDIRTTEKETEQSDRAVSGDQNQEPKKVTFRNDEEEKEEEMKPKDEVVDLVKEAKNLELKANSLKDEHRLLFSFANELQELTKKRSAVVRSRSKDPFASKIVRPYKAQLQIQGRQMVELMEFDAKLLDRLATITKRVCDGQDERQLLADIEHVRKRLVIALRRERWQTMFVEGLFQEEAKRMWFQKQAEWSSESEARDSIVERTMQLVESYVHSSLTTILQRLQGNVSARDDVMQQLNAARRVLARSQRQTVRLSDDDDGWNPSLRLPDIQALHLDT